MYTRLFTKILDSSINVQSVPPSARWLFITMLLIADDDQTGVVNMPLERLAARAGLSIDETKAAIDLLSSADEDSDSKENEGRRIVPMPDGSRGWMLVNWEKYRKIGKADHRREQVRQAVARHRGNHLKSSVRKSKPSEAQAKAHSKAPSDSEAQAHKENLAAARPHEQSVQDGLSLFDSFWKVLVNSPQPKPVHKTAARRAFAKVVDSPEIFGRVLAARQRYASSKRVAEGFVQDASTWINDWEQWENFDDRAKRSEFRPDGGKRQTAADFADPNRKVGTPTVGKW